MSVKRWIMQCFRPQCLDVKGPELLPNTSVDVEVDTRWPLTIYLNSSETDNNGSIYHHFSTKAIYILTYNSTVQEWGLDLVERGENTYLRMFIAMMIQLCFS